MRLNVQGVPDAKEMFNAGWCAAVRFCDREDVVYDGLVGPSGCPAFESAYRDAWTALSAAPAASQPAQPQQPLTDEQIEAIYTQETGALIDDSPWALVDFVRAIEQAHGIGVKND